MTQRTQTTMTRHLSTAGVTACAAVLVNLSVASASGLDPQAWGRAGVTGTASGARLDRALRPLEPSGDEPSGSSPLLALLPRPFTADAAARSRLPSPFVRASWAPRALEVLLFAPKHGPPASLA